MRISFLRYRLLGCVALAMLLAGCDPPKPATQAPQTIAPDTARCHATSGSAANRQSHRLSNSAYNRLIDEVEKANAQGEADYRKGKLPEAKAEFDRAVDLMLSSGIDIKSTPALQDEFDRIVDSVNALEMDALKQGNGFAPKIEPTPADVASDVTFVVDPNIVAKARSDLATTKSDLAACGERLRRRLYQLLCQHATRPQHASARIPALRPLQGDDSARHGRRRRTAGSDLPCGR